MILKGNIIFTSRPDKFETYPNSYILVIDGKVKSITKEIPKGYTKEDVEDLGNSLIIPGFVDIHVHAPQLYNVGIGYSKQLIPWLNEYTFPLESKFKDIEFAYKAYEKFVKELCKVGTTRSCVMATLHKDATKILIELFEKSGLGSYIGKVNMDRNSPSYLIENTKESIRNTKELILELKSRNRTDDNFKPLVNYIISPRFVPSTTPELMKGLGKISKDHEIPIQSHLDENNDEIRWVKELHPECNSFCEVYEYYGLLRKNKTIMAHCIYNEEDEIEILKKYNIMVAHCPQSNFNLSSGIMPLRKYLNKGISVGLGSDVGAGHTLDMTLMKHTI
ncbi:amidohydrolase family protein [Romboutsia sp. Marseille-P6047]|uniref:amidohydrolase family protein n=1 Tax=Romboutsia sp. Marseille-P6047 TaxID=2161817 RepID=UPI002ED0D504